jgi:hypothetical protein
LSTKKTNWSAILAKLPAGSSEEKVKSFLRRSGIGEEELRAYYPLEEGYITCRIEFDPKKRPDRTKDHSILFRMDERKCLKGISIKV